MTALPRTRPAYVKKQIKSSKTTKSPERVKRDPPSLPPKGGEGGPFIFPFDASNEKHVKDLKSLLQKLPPNLKKEVSDFLLLDLVVKSKDTDRELDLWINSVLFHLRAILPSTSTRIMRNTPAYKLFVDSHKDLIAFTMTSDVPTLTIYQRGALYNILAEMLVKHCSALSKKHKFPLSLKYVLQSSSLVAGLFDNAYPGYLRSGMLLLILDKLQVPTVLKPK
jgi:hypothetical protein